MNIAELLKECGFPRAAEFIDGTPQGVLAAQRELKRFKPCGMNEAIAKARAMNALPVVWVDENDSVEWY